MRSMATFRQLGVRASAGVRVLAIVAIAAGVIVTATTHARADRVTPTDTVKVGVNVYTKAGSKRRIGRIETGRFAKLLKKGKKWHKVRLPNSKKVGYVSARYTTIVDDAPADVAATGPLVVTFVDVGQGDAILLQVGAVDLLVDAGTKGAWTSNLGDALKSVTGPLEALYISHPHDDHYGSAAMVLDSMDVAAVYTNGERRGPPRDDDPLASWDEFEQTVKDEGLTAKWFTAGDVITPADGLSLTVLATGSPSGGQFPDTSSGSDINNDSLVILVEYAGARMLLTGDIEEAADQLLIERYCTNEDPDTCPGLHADVLKVQHHGSSGFAPDFIKAVGATWGVVSADYKSKKHHLPRTDSIDALRNIGTKVISTSADGDENVVLTISDQGAITWSMPTVDFFAWRKKAGTNTTYSEVTYVQGE